MYDSILTSIKKLLGIAEDYHHFDTDLIMHINTVFMILHQMGVGPEEPFSIEDDTATWDDFLDGKNDLAAVKNYIALKVRLVFDPPTASAHMQAITEAIKEYEWRLYSAESSKNFDPDKIADLYGDLSDLRPSSNSARRREVVWSTEVMS